MDISACVVVLNEEQNIPLLMKSLKDCKEVIVADGGSTDKTMELASSLGATVYSRNDKLDIATQTDIDYFKSQFGWEPKFTVGTTFRNSAQLRNEVMEHTKNDWIFYPDADEIVSWDLAALEKLQDNNMIQCPLVQTRDKDGNPTYWNMITKLFRKSSCRWYGRIHEVIAGQGPKVTCMDMRIDHYKKSNNQSHVWGYLEYSLLKDHDSRSMFYLGRELFWNKEYKKALRVFEEYMTVAQWRPEISYAFLIRARCAWELHEGNTARQWCLNAIAINPDFKEALAFMAEITGEDQKQYWKRYANVATSDNVLFVNAKL